MLGNGNIVADKVYLYKFNSKKSENLSACTAKFVFLKNHINEYFF